MLEPLHKKEIIIYGKGDMASRKYALSHPGSHGKLSEGRGETQYHNRGLGRECMQFSGNAVHLGEEVALFL